MQKAPFKLSTLLTKALIEKLFFIVNIGNFELKLLNRFDFGLLLSPVKVTAIDLYRGKTFCGCKAGLMELYWDYGCCDSCF